ncbi:MAG: hypothetical protein K6G11_02500, partial [Lachnospiraceae bacterium]|nr:hypothetical protein [Lachnospiraceae bacterium]
MGGAIGKIRISGENTLDIVGKIFRNFSYINKKLNTDLSEENHLDNVHFENSDDKNLDEKNSGDKNLDTKNPDDKNLDTKNPGDKNIDSKNLDEKNLDEKNFDENNSGNKNIDTKNPDDTFSNYDWDFEYFHNKESHTIHYGYIVDDDENVIDEVLVLLMKAPKTYTREDVIEIDTHGGIYSQQQIMKALVNNGARIAEPGEFTKRAFLNGRINLSEAESVMDLINSDNEYALKNSLKHLEGKFGNIISKLRKSMLDDMSFIEAGLDDPEHIDIEGFTGELSEKIDSYI